jgi:hypothetical protein
LQNLYRPIAVAAKGLFIKRLWRVISEDICNLGSQDAVILASRQIEGLGDLGI